MHESKTIRLLCLGAARRLTAAPGCGGVPEVVFPWEYMG